MNMALWPMAFLVVTLLFIGVAIYEHVISTSLSLPISPYMTIPTILLPVLALTNAFVYLRFGKSRKRHDALLARALQVVQALCTTVLATLLFSNIVPSAVRDCLLSTIWQRLFSIHDAEAIRRIQDTFNCCGFNTVRDRAWPFADHQSARRCAETYGRQVSCAQPWLRALQQSSGLDFGIVLAVGLFQIATLFLLSGSMALDNEGRVRPRGMIHYGSIDGIDGPETARLLPGVVGDAGDGPGEDGEDTRPDVERESSPATDDSSRVRVRGSVPTQDNNPWQ